MAKNSKYNVGDAVKIYGSDFHSEYYIIGRIIHIDHFKDKNEYGVIYYKRDTNETLTMQAPEHQIEKILLKNLPGCPSHSFVMNYIDEQAEWKRDIEEFVEERTHKGKYDHLYP